MKAAQLVKYGEPLQVREVPTPRPTGKQVLVRVRSAGVCHSDVHFVRGDWRDLLPVPLPVTLGHEVAGVVEEVGEDVGEVRRGQAVILYGGWGCGGCRSCRRGEEQLCAASSWIGFVQPGGFAEYILVPSARYLVPAEGLDMTTAAPIADAALTPYRAIKKVLPQLAPDDAVLVLGVGGLGHCAVQLLKALSPACAVVAVDVLEERLALARELGADEAFLVGEAPEKIAALTGRSGVRAALDFVGSDASAQLAIQALASQGWYVTVGLFGGSISYSGFASVIREIHTAGSLWGNLAELHEVVTLAKKGRLRLHVEKRPLTTASEALDELGKGRVAGRLVLIP